ETGRIAPEIRACGEKMACGVDDPALLAVRDRRGRPAILVRSSVANFDEHERFAVEHDQIELSGFAAVVAQNESQACFLEISERRVFGVATGFHAVHRILRDVSMSVLARTCNGGSGQSPVTSRQSPAQRTET